MVSKYFFISQFFSRRATTPTTNLREEVWTSTPNASDQCAPAGWVQQGTNGLGSSSKYIMTSVSLYDQISNKNYIYIVVGNGLGTSAIKVVRQAD